MTSIAAAPTANRIARTSSANDALTNKLIDAYNKLDGDTGTMAPKGLPGPASKAAFAAFKKEFPLNKGCNLEVRHLRYAGATWYAIVGGPASGAYANYQFFSKNDVAAGAPVRR